MANHGYRLTPHGEGSALALETMPDPTPAPHEIVIRHTAWGINGHDMHHMSGLLPLPEGASGFGVEAMGVIEACGSEVAGFQLGERICYSTAPPGAFVERRAIDPRYVITAHDSLSDEQTMACFRKGMTAHYLLYRTFFLRPSYAALVIGASGGVGHLLCQWGKSNGARMLGLVSTPEKVAFSKANGCETAWTYNTDNLQEVILSTTYGKGVDVVYDCVGGEMFQTMQPILGRFGLWVSVGYGAGLPAAISPMMLTPLSHFMTAPSLDIYKRHRMEAILSAHELFERVANGTLTPHIHQTYAFPQLPEALQLMAQRGHVGSLVVMA